MPTILTGTVLTGEKAGWTIKVEDDRNGETGVFLLNMLRDDLLVSTAQLETLEQLQVELSQFDTIFY